MGFHITVCMYMCISCNASPGGSNLVLRQRTRLEGGDGDSVCVTPLGFEPRASMRG